MKKWKAPGLVYQLAAHTKSIQGILRKRVARRSTLYSKPVARLVFQGRHTVLEESRDSKPESLFHTICYHNQSNTVNAGKDLTFRYVTTAKVELDQIFGRFLRRSYQDKATIKNSK